MHSDRVFACGDTGTGKSYFLSRQILPRYPRVIILDVTGEMWQSRNVIGPGTLCETAAEVTTEVAKLAGRQAAWRIYAVLSKAETYKLAALMTPEERIATAPSLARAVGGLALYCDELETLAGHASPEVVNGLWNRGRHVGLTVVGATQYPASVKPLVRGASRLFVVGQLSDPNAVEYLARAGFPSDVVEWINALAFQELVLFDKRTRNGWHLARDHSTIARYLP